jgi:hypothetical protein
MEPSLDGWRGMAGAVNLDWSSFQPLGRGGAGWRGKGNMLGVPLLRVETGESTVGEKKESLGRSPCGPGVRSCKDGACDPIGNWRGAILLMGGPLSPVVERDLKLVLDSLRPIG